MGPRESFLAAGTSFCDLVAAISDDRWATPGLGVWDVRALVGHTNRAMVTVVSYLGAPAELVELTSPAAYFVATRSAASPQAVAERGVEAGRQLGADPAAVVRASYAEAQQALASVKEGDDPVVSTVAGAMALSQYLPTRTFELIAHSLDIGAATGLEVVVPRDAMTESLAVAAALAATGDRATHTLRALLGRTALPEGHSVLDG